MKKKSTMVYRILLFAFVLFISAEGFSQWDPSYIQVTGMGNEGQGAGVAYINLDNNPRPEMVILAYDNPSGPNNFRYKIGWNIGVNGVAASWSNYVQVSGVGNEGQGAGVAIGNLDSNTRPEMILMAYDSPSGSNSFRYRIAWNLGANGVAASWSNYNQIPGVGNEGQGADVAIVNLDADAKQEIVLVAYDNPAGGNNFRYKIGWNQSEYSLSHEDVSNEFVGYVSDQEDRFVDYVWGFIDEFKNTWTNTQYYWGQSRFLGADHLSYVDSADLAYLAGHGSPSNIVLKGSEGGCYLGNKAWGSYSSADRTGDLEYIVFHSCRVLEMNDNWRERWRNYESTKNEKRPFSGLHIAMGFRTNHYNGSGAGRWAADEFAENLEDGYSVREAWYEAAEDARFLSGWQGNKPAIFFIRPHKDERIFEHNAMDLHYGDPDYILDTYYMN